MKYWLMTVLVFLMASCTPNDNPPTHTKQSHTVQDGQSLRVLTPDWSIASVLIAIGLPPVAMGDVKSYQDWSRYPAVPASVMDLGARFSPNPELMAQLSPDLVIDNDFYQHLRPMYGDAVVQSVNLNTDVKSLTWQDYAKHTEQIGELVQRGEQAKQYIQQSEWQIGELGRQFASRQSIKKLAVVQFASATQLRMYAKNSLFEPTLTKMGLSLYTIADGNAWGFVDAKLMDLAQLEPDVCLVVIEPFSAMLQAELAKNALWQQLKFGQTGDGGRCMMILPPTWISGALPSMVGFAQDLANAVPVGGRYVK